MWLIAFFLLFHSFGLPNSNPPVSRPDIWRQLPFIYLELVDPLPDEAALPSGWRYFPQRFDLLAVAAVILASAAALGRSVLRGLKLDEPLTRLERLVFSCGVGLAGLSLVTLGCGYAGLLERSVLGGILCAVIGGEIVYGRRQQRRRSSSGAAPQKRQGQSRRRDDPTDSPSRSLMWLCGAVAAGFLLAMLLGAMLPSVDFDVKEYHLQGPKEFYQNGRISFLPHNVYTSFPFLTEMLSLLAMVLRDDWFRGALAGKAVLMCFAPLTALAVYAAGKRFFSETAGVIAALVYFTTPWTYRISIIAYAEGGLTFYLFATMFALLLGRELSRSSQEAGRVATGRERAASGSPSTARETSAGKTSSGAPFPRETLDPAVWLPWMLLTGWLAGSAMACKYPGVVQVVIPTGLAALFIAGRNTGATPRWKTVGQTAGLFAAGVLLAVGPWLLKNTLETGNPVYPLLWNVFGGRDWNAALNAKWTAAHSPDNYALSDLVVKLLDVTCRSDWLSPLLFGLAPLAVLFTPHRRLISGLWVYVGFLFFAWWGLTHRLDRFWIPLIPVVALLAGVGFTWNRHWLWLRAAGCVIAVAVLFNLGFITTPLCGYNAYLADLQAARRQSVAISAPGIAFVNRLPADARVLCVGEAQVFDARREVVYNTVFDRSLFQQWVAEPVPETPPAELPLRPADVIRRKLRSQGITHVYVNWPEILRYRKTYGYTDFVTPQRFRALQESGVLGRPLSDNEPGKYKLWEKLSERDRKEIERWGPELRTTFRGYDVIPRFEIYPVLQAR